MKFYTAQNCSWCPHAARALYAAGYRDADVETVYIDTDPLAAMELQRITRSTAVPVLVTDAGEVYRGFGPIRDWAKTHPRP